MTPDLTRAAAARRELVERLKIMFPQEDEESLADTVEGLSDFDEVVLATVRAGLEREAYAFGLAGMISTLQIRKARLEEGADKLRAAALQAMQEAGVSKIKAADMSLSVSAGRGRVVIVDETKIPDEYAEMVRQIHKREIGDALKRGETVDGAELGNPVPFLTVRRT